jgi:hypothetical protein
MLVKSEAAKSPGAWTWLNITGRAAPAVARHCWTRRSNVRRWLGVSWPGDSVWSQSNSVLARRRGSTSSRAWAFGHSSASGSFRVR